MGERDAESAPEDSDLLSDPILRTTRRVGHLVTKGLQEGEGRGDGVLVQAHARATQQRRRDL